MKKILPYLILIAIGFLSAKAFEAAFSYLSFQTEAECSATYYAPGGKFNEYVQCIDDHESKYEFIRPLSLTPTYEDSEWHLRESI